MEIKISLEILKHFIHKLFHWWQRRVGVHLGILSQPVSQEICYLVYMISSFYDTFNGL